MWAFNSPTYRGTENFTQDDWIQYLELIESLGGSAAIRAAKAQAASFTKLSSPLASMASGNPEAITLEFSQYPGGFWIQSTNQPPPAGAGFASGAGLPVGTFPGMVGSNGPLEALLETAWADFSSQGPSLVGRFRKSKDGPTTGVYIASVGSGDENPNDENGFASGIFKFRSV